MTTDVIYGILIGVATFALGTLWGYELGRARRLAKPILSLGWLKRGDDNTKSPYSL